MAETNKYYELAYECYVVRKTWTASMVKALYTKKKITKAEYDQIIAARED